MAPTSGTALRGSAVSELTLAQQAPPFALFVFTHELASLDWLQAQASAGVEPNHCSDTTGPLVHCHEAKVLQPYPTPFPKALLPAWVLSLHRLWFAPFPHTNLEQVAKLCPEHGPLFRTA